MANKAQALAKFMVECTIANQKVGGQEEVDKQIPEQGKPKENLEMNPKEYWMLYFDGALKTKTSEACLFL